MESYRGSRTTLDIVVVVVVCLVYIGLVIPLKFLKPAYLSLNIAASSALIKASPTEACLSSSNLSLVSSNLKYTYKHNDEKSLKMGTFLGPIRSSSV